MRTGRCNECGGDGELYPKGARICWPCHRALDKRKAKLARDRKKEGTGLPVGEPCECCAEPMTAPCRDHCHATDQDRGWLCIGCNVCIGQAGESAGVCIDRAIANLERCGRANAPDRKDVTLARAARWLDRARYIVRWTTARSNRAEG